MVPLPLSDTCLVISNNQGVPTDPSTRPQGGRGSLTSAGPDPAGGARLRAVILKLGRRLRTIEVGSDLTQAEFSALATIVRRGRIRPSELAEAEGVNPTMLSRMLSRMAATGVVSRAVAPEDHRAAVVEATAEGRRRHRKLRSVRAHRLEAALQEMPDAERQSVLEALPGLEALAELLGQRWP